MTTLNLEVTREQLEVIYSALIDASSSADMRSDDMVENIDSVEDAYWIAELVEAKIQQKQANDLRSFIRDAIKKADDFDWNSVCATQNEKLADDIKNALRVGVGKAV